VQALSLTKGWRPKPAAGPIEDILFLPTSHVRSESFSVLALSLTKGLATKAGLGLTRGYLVFANLTRQI